MTIPEYDVVLVGAGFGAIATLHRLRKQGLKCKIVEKGSRSGGIWYWNCYPGARVDSDAPIYQLFDRDVWQDFSFTERYPGWQELRRYFDYLDKKIEFSKDVEYDCELVSGRFDEGSRKWFLTCKNGTEALARWFIPAIGFAAKPYKPALMGMENFKGPLHHTAEWPQNGLDLKDKRIAVVGTGASGVQTIQESSHDAKQLTVYQRTPNLCCPMNQHDLEREKNEQLKREGKFDEAFETTPHTFAGFNYDFLPKKTWDDPPEERKKVYHDLLVSKGGFHYWLNTYSDMLYDREANLEAYNFWRDYTRSRIKDPHKRDILAPIEPPHPWGTKRPSLEQYYYECYNLPQVDIVDVNADPIEVITETGIRTSSGHREFDVIILATGFDAVTGSLAQLDIRGADGHSIKEHWASGLKTSIGISLHGFPNMFFLYGPGAPTAFSNGPSCVQFQAEWIAITIKGLREQGIDRFEPTKDLEDGWTKQTQDIWDSTLFPLAKSWYQGSNIPGKKVEPLNYAGGMPKYLGALYKSNENNYQGWNIAAAA